MVDVGAFDDVTMVDIGVFPSIVSMMREVADLCFL
jgi:hypothetical protein